MSPYPRVATGAFDDHTVVESTIEVPAGDCTLAVHLQREGAAGWVELSIDGTTCGRETIPLYLSAFTSVGASVGEDHGSAVSDRYSAPFAFTGTLHDVTIQLPDGRDAATTTPQPRASGRASGVRARPLTGSAGSTEPTT